MFEREQLLIRMDSIYLANWFSLRHFHIALLIMVIITKNVCVWIFQNNLVYPLLWFHENIFHLLLWCSKIVFPSVFHPERMHILHEVDIISSIGRAKYMLNKSREIFFYQMRQISWVCQVNHHLVNCNARYNLARYNLDIPEPSV